MKERKEIKAWWQAKSFTYPLVLVVLLSALALAVTFSWFQRHLLESVLDTNYSFFREATNQQVITIQTKLSGQWQQLALYARIFENIQMSDYTAVKGALNVTDGFGDFKRISVANDVGYVINNDNTASGNILKQKYFREAMEGRLSISAEPDVDADGEEIFIVSIPIYQRGNPAGALLGTFNRASLQELISEEVFGGNGTFYVIDSSGAIILNGKNARIPETVDNYFDYMELVELGNAELEAFRGEIRQSGEGTLEYTSGNTDMVIYYQSVQVNDWTLVSAIEKDFILQQSQQIGYLVFVLIVTMLLIVAAMAGYAFWILRQRARETLQNESLKIRAERDPLTRLYNKIALEEYVTQRISGNEQAGENGFALFILDLDNFKGVNDTLGHAFGDSVLCDAADCMQRVFSRQDILGRIGGDEFMALLDMSNVPLREREPLVRKRAQMLCEDFSRTYTVQNTGCKVSVSVGVAFYGTHGRSFAELYKNADKALYEAKNQGKNNYVIYR